MKTPSFRARIRRRDRQGLAVVELAIYLPLLILLVFGSIDCCTMIYLKHSLTVASYEGARVALQSGSNSGDVTAASATFLAMRQVQGANITTTPANVNSAQPGDVVTVRVSAPCAANAMVVSKFFGGTTLASTTTVIKE